MSYDLFFNATKRKLDRSSFESYFSERRWVTTRTTEHGAQAWYENEDTGVYFSFEWSPDSVALNVNYFRPSMFGLEAADEVTAFVEHFQPAIRDPQSEGMGEGPYSSAGFLRGWNAGNRFAHRAILSQNDEAQTFHVLPGARLQALWRWNYQRERVTDYIGTLEMLPCFVPKILVALVGGNLRTLVIWDGTIPILLPDVDTILVARAGRPMRVARLALDHALATWRIRPADDELEDGMRLGLPAREVVFEDDEVPPELTRAIDEHAIPWDGEGVAWDQLHDEELISPR